MADNKGFTLAGFKELLTKINNTFIKKTDTAQPDSISIDTTPTTGSSNLITSGGVAAYHDPSKQDNLPSTSSQSGKYLHVNTSNTLEWSSVVALRPMKSGWCTGTTAEAAAAILNDADTLAGDGYLATVYWTDLPIPEGPGRQAEVKAFVLKKETNHKLIQFECTSGTTAPYAWFYNSYEGRWRSYVPINNTLTSTSDTEALAASQGKALNEGKANKTTKVTSTMAASNWSTNTYSFEDTYPVATYNIEVELAPTATLAQYKAYGKAGLTGNTDSNVLTALNVVPTVDIPIIITVEVK